MIPVMSKTILAASLLILQGSCWLLTKTNRLPNSGPALLIDCSKKGAVDPEDANDCRRDDPDSFHERGVGWTAGSGAVFSASANSMLI
jgi:hypothetical protein